MGLGAGELVAREWRRRDRGRAWPRLHRSPAVTARGRTAAGARLAASAAPPFPPPPRSEPLRLAEEVRHLSPAGGGCRRLSGWRRRRFRARPAVGARRPRRGGEAGGGRERGCSGARRLSSPALPLGVCARSRVGAPAAAAVGACNGVEAPRRLLSPVRRVAATAVLHRRAEPPRAGGGAGATLRWEAGGARRGSRLGKAACALGGRGAGLRGGAALSPGFCFCGGGRRLPGLCPAARCCRPEPRASSPPARHGAVRCGRPRRSSCRGSGAVLSA